jgi:2-methylcitrate dehydratase
VAITEDLAAFAAHASFRDLSGAARDALKIRILDSLGCAFGALGAKPMAGVRALTADFGGRSLCTLVGSGDRTAPDRAAFFNGALVRYLDFNDSYLAPRETCHPSDNLSGVLAAAQSVQASGATLLTALAVAYQVQCRLSDEAPVRDRGFDHTTQGACAAAAGASRALGLSAEQTANAIAIAVTTSPALRVTRTGPLSHWKGLAAPHATAAGTHAAFLARQGITGPLEAFEGNKGFIDVISGPFSIDWRSEDLDAVSRTSIKRYNAEVHSQSAIEGLLSLLSENGVGVLAVEDIRLIEVDVFDVAHRIIGGGEEGDKTVVRTKEEADHSLPYMIAVAALDRQLMPEQYAPERIARRDVQTLLRRVAIRPRPDLSARFPAEHPARIRLELSDGRSFVKDKSDYLGFFKRPMSWPDVRAKFESLAAPKLPPERRSAIAETVMNLEDIGVDVLCTALAGSEPRALKRPAEV